MFSRSSSRLFLLVSASACWSSYADQAKPLPPTVEKAYMQSQHSVCILSTYYPNKSLEQQK